MIVIFVQENYASRLRNTLSDSFSSHIYIWFVTTLTTFHGEPSHLLQWWTIKPPFVTNQASFHHGQLSLPQWLTPTSSSVVNPQTTFHGEPSNLFHGGPSNPHQQWILQPYSTVNLPLRSKSSQLEHGDTFFCAWINRWAVVYNLFDHTNRVSHKQSKVVVLVGCHNLQTNGNLAHPSTNHNSSSTYVVQEMAMC